MGWLYMTTSDFTMLPNSLLTASLTSTQRVVYAVLKSYYRKNHLTTPSINLIADNIGCSRRTVERALATLEAAGYIRRSRRRQENGAVTSNSYEFFDTPATPVSHPLRHQCRIEEYKFKNILFKFKKHATNNTTDDIKTNQPMPQQTDIEDFTTSDRDIKFLKAMQKLGKGSEWVQLVRSFNQYYIRPVSAACFNYITQEQIDNFRQFIAEQTGSCQSLKWGQHLDKEIIVRCH